MRWFQVVDDVPLLGRWYLNGVCDAAGSTVDARIFTYGLSAEIGPGWIRCCDATVATPLSIAMRRTGSALDFSFADFDVPIVRRHLGMILKEISGDDIQLIPITVKGFRDEFVVLNVASRVECIDRNRSEIVYWTHQDGIAEKVGRPRMVMTLRVSPVECVPHRIFRVRHWEIAMIVCEDIRDALEQYGCPGVRTREV